MGSTTAPLTDLIAEHDESRPGTIILRAVHGPVVAELDQSTASSLVQQMHRASEHAAEAVDEVSVPYLATWQAGERAGTVWAPPRTTRRPRTRPPGRRSPTRSRSACRSRSTR